MDMLALFPTCSSPQNPQILLHNISLCSDFETSSKWASIMQKLHRRIWRTILWITKNTNCSKPIHKIIMRMWTNDRVKPFGWEVMQATLDLFKSECCITYSQDILLGKWKGNCPPPPCNIMCIKCISSVSRADPKVIALNKMWNLWNVKFSTVIGLQQLENRVKAKGSNLSQI